MSCTNFEEKGILAFEEEDYASAEEYFLLGLKYDNRNVSYMYNLARSQEKLEKYSEAIKNYSDALIWDNMLLDANLGRARCFSKLENFKKANYDLKHYLEYRPKDLEALILSGKCNMKLWEFEDALKDLTVARGMDENNINVIYLLAVTEGRLGFYHTSESLFNKTISLDPEMAQAYYGLATIMYMQKMYKEALSNYEIAENKGLEYSYMAVRKGLCYVNLNDLSSACKQFSLLKDTKLKENLNVKYCKR